MQTDETGRQAGRLASRQTGKQAGTQTDRSVARKQEPVEELESYP